MMKPVFSRKKLTVCLFVFTILSIGGRNAFCQFDVDWGVSPDSGLTGYQQIAQWLVDNSFFVNLADAQVFSETAFIGHEASEADPFYWNISSPVEVEIVDEFAGFADQNRLGFYTGSGNTKTLKQILGGTQDGPKSLLVSQPFGLYLETPQNHVWFTDRAEHESQQSGAFKHAGGNAQGLIYEIEPHTKWLVAWEDLDAAKSGVDRDYNDMYVTLTKKTLAPEPISSVLFLLGGSALVAVRMRRQASRS